MTAISWKEQPDEHDYPAAVAYLSLLLGDELVTQVLTQLQSAAVQHGKAKDLLRAARLELLPETNPEVAKDLAKIKAGKLLSPVLLVRGDLLRTIPLHIADGYHRVCASYHIDEDSPIPYRIANTPAPAHDR